MDETIKSVTMLGGALVVAALVWLMSNLKPPRGGTNGGY